jgi:hypothetical protein
MSMTDTEGEAEMAEQVPNLEEMDQQEAYNFLDELFSRLNAEAEYQMPHEDYTMGWPQSGERLLGRQKICEQRIPSVR